MNIESWTASLHAGLIQRTRSVSGNGATRDEVKGSGATGKTAQRDAELDKTVLTRESAISRARSILSRSPDLYDAEMPERVPPAERVAPAMRIPPSARAPDTHGYGGWAFGRRFCLTVRVSAALREMLLDARLRTGRTTQRILHDALVQYLDSLDRKPGQR